LHLVLGVGGNACLGGDVASCVFGTLFYIGCWPMGWSYTPLIDCNLTPSLTLFLDIAETCRANRLDQLCTAL
jgi:hypothetical protein